VNWYTARVLFRWKVGGRAHPFEESYLLVRANSQAAALRTAERAGKAREQSYKNPRGQPVKSTLVSILEVQEGVEVYSRRVSKRAAAAMLQASSKSAGDKSRRGGAYIVLKL
jgi:hypothetical protein